MGTKKGFLEGFESVLESNCGKGLQWFFGVSFLAGFFASMAAIAASLAQNWPNLYITLFAVGAFAAPFPLHFFFQHYLFELNRRKKESVVPDVLLQASAFPRGVAFEKIIGYFSAERFSLLGREFERANAEIGKGANVQDALENIALRCKSRVIGRMVMLLRQGYESGAEMGQIFREAADDLLETNAILREKNAALVIEKYTLLLAGGIIVPVVLGLLIGMVSSMDFSALDVLGFGSGFSGRGASLSMIVAANHIYIIEYSLLAAFFVAHLEGQPKKALLYAVFLLPLSLLSLFSAMALLG